MGRGTTPSLDDGVGPPSSSTAAASALRPPSVRALAWDPTATASLTICPLPPTSSSSSSSLGATKNTIDLDVFLSHDGTGCSARETECLLRCLDARGRRTKKASSSSRARGDDDATTTRSLSMDYRAAVRDCIGSLEEEGARRRRRASDAADAASAADHDDDDGGNDDGSLESLRLIHAVSHLAEIFLLPQSSSSSSSGFRPTDLDGGFRDAHAGGGRRGLDGPAGSMTADAVRYLRLHHGRGRLGGGGGAGSSLGMDAPWVRTMLGDDQPEYYAFPGESPPSDSDADADADADADDSPPEGPYDRPYWNLLLSLVVRGELAAAWTLLSHHSACRRAEEEAAEAEGMGGGMMREMISPEAEGFAALRAILMSAPIPGGRGLDDDDAHRDNDDVDQDEDGDGGGGITAAFGDSAGDDVDDVPLVDGVPPGADLLWEAFPRRAHRLRTLRRRRDLLRGRRGADDEGVVGGGWFGSSSSSSPILPELYQPRAAMSAFRIWQEAIRNIAFPGGVGGGPSSGGGGGGLSALFKRFPPLRQIVSIMVGSAPPSIAGTSTSLEWSDALLMELLYSRPDIMPEDIAARARVAMSKRGVGGGGRNDTLEEIIVAIMSGNPGQVIEAMFSICGGSSGAALPATMTSLLCNLLVDAGCISLQQDWPSSNMTIQTELLLLSAEAIVSSFSVKGQCNVGVRAAIDLLLPYSLPKRAESSPAGNNSTTNWDIVYEPQIAAMIAQVLSHRLPATDAEARDLLKLCEDTVRLGSIPIADACESLAFSRASHYKSNGIYPREVYWLLRGMEVQSSWLPSDRRRRLGFASRRHFDSLCERSANALISTLSIAAIANLSNAGVTETQEKEMSRVLKVAADVLEGILQDDIMAQVLKGHVEANLLKYSVDIALADAKGETVQVATDMIHCLEERCLSEDYGGVVSTLADPLAYSDFLHIAFAILVKEDDVSKGLPMEFAKCAFTVHGMHILMARLTQVLAWEGVICVSDESPKQLSDARKEYFRAMRLAFCKGLMRAISNEQPASTKFVTKKKKGGEMSLEEEIELMLSPCI